MVKATIRRVLGIYSACPRHVYAEGLPKGCGTIAEGFPKHPKAMLKTQTTPDWTPKASQGLADDAEGLRGVAEGFPKTCGAPRSRPESNLRVKILNLLKVRCRRYFDPESVPKASRRDAEGFPIIPKACRRYAEGGEFAMFAFGNASGTLRGPSGDEALKSEGGGEE